MKKMKWICRYAFLSLLLAAATGWTVYCFITVAQIKKIVGSPEFIELSSGRIEDAAQLLDRLAQFLSLRNWGLIACGLIVLALAAMIVCHVLSKRPKKEKAPKVKKEKAPKVKKEKKPAAVPVAPVVETPAAVPVAPVVETPAAVPVTPVVETPAAVPVAPVVETPAAVPVAPVVETPAAVPVAPVVEQPVDELEPPPSMGAWQMPGGLEDVVEAPAAPESRPVFCSQCGKRFEKQPVFCNQCGNRF